jgi:acyl-CoA thioester hydrolase
VTDRPPRSTRTDYGYWETHTTRWADIDVYGHMNNARYFELIDTVVNNQLVHGTGVDIRQLPAIGVVAEVSCRYFEEIGYPDPVDLGVAAERVGRSSVVYRVGLFQGGSGEPGEEANAEGRFVHVYVDNTVTAGRRPVVPIPEEIRRAVEPLLR